MTQIAFLLYEQMTALDAVGPYDVLARLPGAEAAFVASTPGPYPQPAFDSGSLEKVDTETRDRAVQLFAPATSA